MRIALIGTRGVPANYGGFETCVEELGKRLVRRGHAVTVYCRKSYYRDRPKYYQGMRLVYLPNIQKKALDTLSHTFFSIWHSISENYDILMVFNAANSLALIIPKLLGKRIAINTDGLEWKRGKWGVLARKYYKLSEWLCTKVASRIVADSRGIQDYYMKTYGIDSAFIAYGAPICTRQGHKLLKKFGLSPNEYFLQITRFEPENNPLLTIQAYKRITTDKKLVIVGGVPYSSEYADRILKEAGGNIVLPGFIYDSALLNALWTNCYAYIHGNEVGGTNPALLQAMGAGCFVVAIDIAFSRDVLSDCGIYYDKNAASLADRMRWAIENNNRLLEYKHSAVKRIASNYNWDKVTSCYENMFYKLISGI